MEKMRQIIMVWRFGVVFLLRWDRAVKCDLVLRVGIQALVRETLVMMITNLMIMKFAWK